jgi:dipeptide/tripeptide permease
MRCGMAGLYNAASYLLTLPGGFAVDRSLGGRRSLGAGMALLMLGYAALTLPAASGLGLAIVFLLLGHSLFKPSTQAVMVLLYERHDPRLDAAQIALLLGRQRRWHRGVPSVPGCSYMVTTSEPRSRSLLPPCSLA